MKTKLHTIERAKEYLRGEALNEHDFNDLYTQLIYTEQFGYAAEALMKNIDECTEDGVTLENKKYQDLAKNIYKDHSLSSYFKYKKANNILKVHCDLDHTTNCEILGLAGAIFKYKWKFDHQGNNLLRSEAFYKRGYKSWKTSKEMAIETDSGYTAINYAYISELIATDNLIQLSAITGITTDTIRRYEIAVQIRQEIIDAYIIDPTAKTPVLKTHITKDKWLCSTLAEAYFGKRRYSQALVFIQHFLNENPENWEIKTFLKQLHHLAQMQQIEKKYGDRCTQFNDSEINENQQQLCLDAFNPEKKTVVLTNNQQGKLGLCLSGGGFRSALFHIGVLAGLAEKDMLKDVEVLSCVSGGSIIGSYYYLSLKELLEKTPDLEIQKEDYIKMVKTIEKDFLEAVQKNLRMRLFTNLFDDVKMLFDSDFSRSHRLGHLYEKFFYKRFFKKDADTLYMDELLINPAQDENFNINDNWKRKNKIPQLILNATSVNTGHNWQFTASWMGEPPAYISGDFDVKPRFRRMYYKNAPEKYKKFRLGYAVAASSCVPVLFEPLVLKGIYENVELELIDGGVHDNQGIASVLEQECDHIIISDGSAQMSDNAKCSTGEFSLFFRVDTILQERLREIQLMDLKSREYTAALIKLQILHLKSELNQMPVKWIDCTDETRKIGSDKIVIDSDSLLSYGIMKKIQKLLSEVRTDLDSHNNLEAKALMYSGYRQTMKGTDDVSENENGWNFFEIQEACTIPSQSHKLERQLKVSRYVPFKFLKLSNVALGFVCLFGLAVLVLLYLYIDWKNEDSVITYTALYALIGFSALVFFAGFISKFLSIAINPQGWVKKKLAMLVIVIVGLIFSNFYIFFINPIYNKMGKIK